MQYRPQIQEYRPFGQCPNRGGANLKDASLNPTSQEIHVKQGAGSYFQITLFNGRVIQFRVLRFIIFRIIGKIYQHSKRF